MNPHGTKDMMDKINSNQLWNTVIANGYCSGCGVCTATKNSPFEMELNEKGYFLPTVKTALSDDTNVVCPFATHGVNEDTIAQENFGKSNLKKDNDFGLYKNLYAGFINEGDFRKKGSSGGGVSWMTNQLLKENLVDYIVHIKASDNPNTRYQYSISNSVQENGQGAKSRYYPATMDDVLHFIKNNEGKYAIVSIPCFIKGLHLLKREDPIFNDRITFTISLFCGHLKTTHYLDALVSQFAVETTDVKAFDFRHKIESRKASDYGTEIVLKNGSKKMKLNKELFGTNWGLGLFKLKACDYCDDVIGETADISFGDAWIPKYENDGMGTNIIVTRNNILDALIKKAISSKTVSLEPLTAEELMESQAGGFRHRREGLQYRLFSQKQKKQWVPIKRVQPALLKNTKRNKIYNLRMILQERSVNSAFYKDKEKLKKELMPFIKKLENVNRHSLWTRMRLKLKGK